LESNVANAVLMQGNCTLERPAANVSIC
jgi:hypothetical protein